MIKITTPLMRALVLALLLPLIALAQESGEGTWRLNLRTRISAPL